MAVAAWRTRTCPARLGSGHPRTTSAVSLRGWPALLCAAFRSGRGHCPTSVQMTDETAVTSEVPVRPPAAISVEYPGYTEYLGDPSAPDIPHSLNVPRSLGVRGDVGGNAASWSPGRVR